MGNVERCDTTLPTNEMMFYVRRDPALRARWLTDLPGIAKEFGLSRAEYEAIRDQDPKRLMDLGVHQIGRASCRERMYIAGVLDLLNNISINYLEYASDCI